MPLPTDTSARRERLPSAGHRSRKIAPARSWRLGRGGERLEGGERPVADGAALCRPA